MSRDQSHINEEDEMEKPDLAEMAATIDGLAGTLKEFEEQLSAAENAALGEADKDGNETVPGNGDTYEVYEAAQGHIAQARLKVQQVKGLLAEQQGYRDFEAAGVA